MAQSSNAPVSAPPAPEEINNTIKPMLDLVAQAGGAEYDLSQDDKQIWTLVKGAETDDTLVDQVVEAYNAFRASKGLGLRAARKAQDVIGLGMAAAVTAGDLARAQVFLEIQGAVENAAPAKKESTPVDPTKAWVETYARLTLAIQLHQSILPEGASIDELRTRGDEVVDDEMPGLAEYVNWVAKGDDSEAPELSTLTGQAVKLATTKARKSSGGSGPRAPHEGPRGNIARHIAQVFALGEGKFDPTTGEYDYQPYPAGHYLTSSQIAKVVTPEYPAGNASSGAVSARITGALEKGREIGFNLSAAETNPATGEAKKGIVSDIEQPEDVLAEQASDSE